MNRHWGHIHIPTIRRSPWPGGAELPRDYWHAYDPFISLMMAAAVTSTIKMASLLTVVNGDDCTRLTPDGMISWLEVHHPGVQGSNMVLSRCFESALYPILYD